MIYALVEPSIYMIASILPTTRHLYRRARRNLLQAAQQRNTDSDGIPKNSGVSESAELERFEHSNSSNRGITRRVDIWQANTNSSQEELTLGEWYQNRQDWHQSKAADQSLQTVPVAHSAANAEIARQ